jgi:hypothetical protein
VIFAHWLYRADFLLEQSASKLEKAPPATPRPGPSRKASAASLGLESSHPRGRKASKKGKEAAAPEEEPPQLLGPALRSYPRTIRGWQECLSDLEATKLLMEEVEQTTDGLPSWFDSDMEDVEMLDD